MGNIATAAKVGLDEKCQDLGFKVARFDEPSPNLIEITFTDGEGNELRVETSLDFLQDKQYADAYSKLNRSVLDFKEWFRKIRAACKGRTGHEAGRVQIRRPHANSADYLVNVEAGGKNYRIPLNEEHISEVPEGYKTFAERLGAEHHRRNS